MKLLKIIGIGFAGLFAITFVALAILGTFSPETSIYLQRQIPSRYIEEIRSLELIEKNEQVKYFYSDAMLDIKEGMYFVTDTHLVLYSSNWEEPSTIISFYDIIDISVDYDDSFFIDSMVSIETINYEIEFPLSSEYDRDKKFIEYLMQRIKAE